MLQVVAKRTTHRSPPFAFCDGLEETRSACIYRRARGPHAVRHDRVAVFHGLALLVARGRPRREPPCRRDRRLGGGDEDRCFHVRRFAWPARRDPVGVRPSAPRLPIGCFD